MNDSMRERMEQLLADVRARLWIVYRQMMAEEMSKREWELAKSELVETEAALVSVLFKGGAE